MTTYGTLDRYVLDRLVTDAGVGVLTNKKYSVKCG